MAFDRLKIHGAIVDSGLAADPAARVFAEALGDQVSAATAPFVTEDRLEAAVSRIEAAIADMNKQNAERTARMQGVLLAATIGGNALLGTILGVVIAVT